MTAPLDYDVKAAAMWLEFSPRDRAGVLFALFPFDAMTAAQTEGYVLNPLADALVAIAKEHRILSSFRRIFDGVAVN